MGELKLTLLQDVPRLNLKRSLALTIAEIGGFLF